VEPRRYTFVTIVFEREYEFLWLQARSFRLYCPAEMIAAIVVVENTARVMPEATRRCILAEYGDLAGLVRFVRSTDLALDPGMARGWQTQQLAKLLVAEIVHTDRYVSLDAKNHLVYRLQRAFLETGSGKGRVRALDYTDNALRPNFENVMAFMGLDADAHRRSFTQSSTPYMLHTQIVRRMLDGLATREGMPFPRLFIENGLTEYLLYAAWVETEEGGIARHYDTYPQHNPIVWFHKVDAEGCRETIALTDPVLAPFFAVHRSAMVGFGAESARIVADFWKARGLFGSREDGLRYIAGFRRRHMVRQWAALPRQLAGRAVRRLRIVLGMQSATDP
jgi:hypothetical protein